MNKDKTQYLEYTQSEEIHDLKSIIEGLETKIEKLEKQLMLADVVGRSEQLVCGECNGWGYTVDENGRRKAHCTKCD